MAHTKNRHVLRFFPLEISREQSKDSGLAAVLICLLVNHFKAWDAALAMGVVALVVDMIYPPAFRPFAFVWLGVSNALGTVMSKVLLTLLFAVVVTPVGLVRRLGGVDGLKLRVWKKGGDSVFRERDHVFSPAEIEKPY